MDYEPWPEQGCTLAEARERTADRGAWKEWRDSIAELELDQPAPFGSETPDVGGNSCRRRADLETAIKEAATRIDARFWAQLRDRRLVAYGRPGRPDAALQLISSGSWPALTRVDWERSAVSDDRNPNNVNFTIRVFPVLLAPCRADLIAGCSLLEAFRGFVLDDAEVAALSKEAVRLSPEFESVFVKGRCHPHGVEEWPLAFDRWSMIGTVHPNPEKRSKFETRNPNPLEVVVAAEALIHRYRALITMLRRGDLTGQGLPVVPGHPNTILRPIWSHEDFHFDATRGDVLQDNPESKDRCDRLVRRWIGVVLQKPNFLVDTPHAPSPGTGGQMNATTPGAQTDSKISDSPDFAPFTVAEVLQIGSLSETLTRLVFHHPQVQMLCKRAIAVADKQGIPFEEDAGLVAIFSGHDEPLLPLRYFQKHTDEFISPPLPPPSPEDVAVWAEYFDQEGPAEVEEYYAEVNLRARTLIEMLQNQKVAASAHTADGHLVPIAHTIWSHEEYYVHPPTGDVYDAGSNPMIKRWTGVILVSPSTASYVAPFHVKPLVFDGIRLETTELHSPSTKPSKAIAQVVTTASANKACVSWLTGIMRSNPHVRTESNAELWEKARARWPGKLSRRSFLSARAEAVRVSEAPAWAAAGRPRKSQR